MQCDAGALRFDGDGRAILVGKNAAPAPPPVHHLVEQPRVPPSSVSPHRPPPSPVFHDEDDDLPPAVKTPSQATSTFPVICRDWRSHSGSSSAAVGGRPDVVGDRSARPDIVPPAGGPDVVETGGGGGHTVAAQPAPQIVQDAVHWSDDEFGDDDDDADVNIDDLNLDDDDD